MTGLNNLSIMAESSFIIKIFIENDIKQLQFWKVPEADISDKDW